MCFFTNDLGIPFAVFFDFLSGMRREYISGAQSNEFQCRNAVQFVFEFSDDLGVAFRGKDVIARVVRCVVQVDIQSHVGVKVRCLDTVRQTVCVGEKQFNLVSVPFFMIL